MEERIKELKSLLIKMSCENYVYGKMQFTYEDMFVFFKKILMYLELLAEQLSCLGELFEVRDDFGILESRLLEVESVVFNKINRGDPYDELRTKLDCLNGMERGEASGVVTEILKYLMDSINEMKFKNISNES